MFMKHLFKVSWVLLALIFVTSCSKDSNPVADDDHSDHDHAEAVGCVISSSGLELARYEEGTVTGQITVKVGEDTPLLSIRFIAEDGDLFQPEEDHYVLDWEFSEADIAELEQQDEDERWLFHIHGESEGATNVTFKINHDDHADFVAQPIPVVVTE